MGNKQTPLWWRNRFASLTSQVQIPAEAWIYAVLFRKRSSYSQSLKIRIILRSASDAVSTAKYYVAFGETEGGH
jgi:hypothetical protein